MYANAPAFPNQVTYSPNGDVVTVGQYFDKEGVSIRTYIATKVMAAIAQDTINQGELPIYAAKAAVKFADALIAELSKS